MKVQTNVKAGGGFDGGLIDVDIVAIVIVDVNLLNGGCCKPRKSC